MKLKPCEPWSQSGLSQWVTPSWCQATEAPRPGSFDEEGVGERHEVLAVDRGGDREELRVPVRSNARFRELEGTENEVHHLLRRVRGGDRLGHLYRVPAVREVGAAEGIGERLRPEEGRGLAAEGEGGPALRIHRRPLLDRKPVDDVEEVRLDVVELLLAEHPFEDVETAPPVGVEDVRVERPVGAETDRAAVSELKGAAFAVLQVRLEGRLFRAVVHPRHRRHRLADRSAHGVPLPSRAPRGAVILPLNRSSRGGVPGARGSGPHGEPLAGLPPNAGARMPALPGSRAVEIRALPGWRAVEMPVPPLGRQGVVGSMPPFGLLTVPDRSRRFAEAMQERGEKT